MRCRRCDGLMVVDSFIDMEDGVGPLWLRGWCCVNCGKTAEPVIARRRVARRSRLGRLVDLLTKRARETREVVHLGT